MRGAAIKNYTITAVPTSPGQLFKLTAVGTTTIGKQVGHRLPRRCTGPATLIIIGTKH